MRRSPSRLRPVVLHRLAVAAVALAVAASAVLGGRAYVWCAPMAEARAHCCCPHGASDHDAIRVDCCDDRVTPTLPDTERASAGSVAIAPAPLVAVLALDVLFTRDAPAESWRERTSRAARAGPRERVHARASVYLI